MPQTIEEEIKRRTDRRKSALAIEIIQSKTAVAAASRQFDLTPTEIVSCVEVGKRDSVEGLLTTWKQVTGSNIGTSRKLSQGPSASPAWGRAAWGFR